jgi:hypothetical protein
MKFHSICHFIEKLIGFYKIINFSLSKSTAHRKKKNTISCKKSLHSIYLISGMCTEYIMNQNLNKIAFLNVCFKKDLNGYFIKEEKELSNNLIK